MREAKERMPTMRAFGPLAAGVLLLGIADSMVGSYLVLYASDEVGLSPLQTGIFMSAPPVGSIVVSFLAGRRIDRHPRRIYAVLAAMSGAARAGHSRGPRDHYSAPRSSRTAATSSC